MSFVSTWQMHTRSGANYLHRCVPKFKNVAALDARNTDGINKTRSAIQTNAKQMISYHTKEQVIETGSHIDPVYVLLASPDNSPWFKAASGCFVCGYRNISCLYFSDDEVTQVIQKQKGPVYPLIVFTSEKCLISRVKKLRVPIRKL